MIAVISDIHSNGDALSVATEIIEAEHVDAIYCLGDVIGYGAEPLKCYKVSREFKLNLMGNHEEAVVLGTQGFNARAAGAIDWTRNQFAPQEQIEMFDWPTVSSEDGITFVHGSPRNHTTDYVMKATAAVPGFMPLLFTLFDRVCFVGHSHLPGAFFENGSIMSPDELDGEYELKSGKAIINIGSIGQPRDQDPRGCFVFFDGETVRYRRFDYDVESAAHKILAVPQLEDRLATRLRTGT